MPEPLEIYRAKRDFTKTREPSGRQRAAPAKRLRFVIQKHAATRLHYDLRLEFDGVFKSWAVTRGPSLDPHERRLAVEVEDHPLDYGDFEGVIPKGEYGGGTVMLWDRGYWELEKGKSVAEGLKKGHLSFAFDGKRLRGGWSLVRIRDGGKRKNWLLIKHDDDTARRDDEDALLKRNATSVASGRSMEKIAEGKGRAPTPFVRRTKRKVLASSAPRVRAVAKTSAKTAVVLGVSISHPDKVLWPSTGDGPISKLEMVEYIATAAIWMLPYVKGRPCSIVRTPDGVDGERFFQRHTSKATSSRITSTRIKGEAEPYLQFDTAEALVAGAQNGTSEFHPWNCVPGKPEVPGRFVFDLDPDEAMPFERVIEAAKTVRDRLADVGLASFLKTTGGKGLHVVAPFTQARNPIGWGEARAFTREICARMAADDPGAYTVNMSKKVRGGRIFLDYLRNDRTATAVSVLSPRARAGAPVSMPLGWKEAKKGLDPKAFTIRTAVARMKKRDPWDGWEDAATPLKDAIAKLK